MKKTAPPKMAPEVAGEGQPPQGDASDRASEGKAELTPSGETIQETVEDDEGQTASGPGEEAENADEGDNDRVTEKPAAWPIPEGPLDDRKYVEISAKYAAALESLPEDERSSELSHLILEKILKDASVTEPEYNRYTDQIAADAQRTERVTDAIIKRLEQQSAWRWTGGAGKEMQREE